MQGNRKILAAVVAALLGVGAVLLKGDVPPNFLQLLTILFGAFVAGNVGEHITNVFKPASASEVTVAPSPPVEEAKVEEPAPAPVEEVSKDDAVVQELVKLNTLVQANLDGTKANSDAIAIVQQALSMIISKYGIDQR